MENNKKSQITTFLMVVGVIFILVAGTIFVTKAWAYLPEIGKQILLLMVTGGMFAGSAKLSKSGELKKTECALFYLGVAFLGFFAIAVMGGIDEALCGTKTQNMAFRLLVSCLFMIVPVGIRLWVKRKGLECWLFEILLDSILIYATFAFEIKAGMFGVLFGIFGINTLLMVLLKRKEMLWIQVISGICISFLQLCWYWLDSWSLFDGVDQTWNTTYYPFSFVLAIGLYIFGVLEKKEQETASCTYLKIAGLQTILGSAMWIASKNVKSHAMVFYLIGMIIMLHIAVVVKGKTAKAIFYTIALLFGEAAVMNQMFFEVPKGYEAEWISFIFAIGIVLLPRIWYDNKKAVRVLQFVCTCILLGILLINDLICGGIGNVLILGAVGVVMLIVASLRNQREYVIASSVTLLLLVFYITRTFWLSIEWWVYLFVAGVVLVTLAIKKEKEV